SSTRPVRMPDVCCLRSESWTDPAGICSIAALSEGEEEAGMSMPACSPAPVCGVNADAAADGDMPARSLERLSTCSDIWVIAEFPPEEGIGPAGVGGGSCAPVCWL